MSATQHKTTVTIIGAGVAGLTSAYMLMRNGVDCIVLERQNREGLEQRNRAGVVEPRANQMFEAWGLGHVLGGFPNQGLIEFRLNGDTHMTRQYPTEEGKPVARECPQQILIKNLLTSFVDEGGDLRLSVRNVSVEDLEGETSIVSYEDEEGVRHEIRSRIIAGCDGDRGVSRASIPAGALTRHTEDYGVTWLVILSKTVPVRHPLYGMSERGFVGQFPRGPEMSRYYLQMPPEETVDDWPDDRIWSEIRVRLGDPDWPAGPILEKEVLPLRAMVCEPMRHGNLFIMGDAAHTFSPTGGKGANCAMFDAEVFARGVIDLVRDGRPERLEAYSDDCLRHAWNYQEFSAWILDLLHDIGDATRVGTFRKGLARARLERILNSEVAAAAYRELAAGLS